ncbi:MAG: winged helix-turn-helix domain-containing protein [Planctomycetes bacterium]|nr:winged helix-turn-helix domain-containing protein [Planctomycetota bacterium]
MRGIGNHSAGRLSNLVGRELELGFLEALLDGPEVQVVFLTGIPGVGTSTLMRAFRDREREGEPAVLCVDCRTIEPTRGEFLRAIEAAGFQADSERRQVLCLDHYDHFLLMDAWLREQFLGRERNNTCLVLANRQAPTFAWRASEFQTRTLRLQVLGRAETLTYLAREGVEGQPALDLWHLTKGHPLALRLALSGVDLGSKSNAPSLQPTELVHELAMYFLKNVESAFLREAIEAASAVRRITPPMLEGMLGKTVTPAEFDSLAATPIIDVRSDGLSLHPTVHEAIAGWLRTTDPSRFTAYRQAAWRLLQDQVRKVGERDTWRYTADVIYLIDDPVIREAFFPSASQAFSVERVHAQDHAALLEIASEHDGAEGSELLALWLKDLPEAIHVVKDAESIVQGFYCLYDPAGAPESVLRTDPVAADWVADMPPALKDQPSRVLFLRRWLTREFGDLPSPGQAACWLDVKRAYLEARPLLQRVYAAVVNVENYGEALGRLGFQACTAPLETNVQRAYLDFGVGSVDAWLAQLVRKSLGLQNLATLNESSRSLELDGRAIALTPREFELVQALLHRDGTTLGRDELLERGWQGGEAVGSNVVDVAIRGLRKKLGERASLIETVRGAGYRWNA